MNWWRRKRRIQSSSSRFLTYFRVIFKEFEFTFNWKHNSKHQIRPTNLLNVPSWLVFLIIVCLCLWWNSCGAALEIVFALFYVSEALMLQRKSPKYLNVGVELYTLYYLWWCFFVNMCGSFLWSNRSLNCTSDQSISIRLIYFLLRGVCFLECWWVTRPERAAMWGSAAW